MTGNDQPRHLLRDDDLSPAEQARLLARAAELKAAPYDAKPLAGPKSVALLFDKPTLRTQSSFSAGIAELGGNPMVIDSRLAGVGERESIPDVARVLGRQASAIVWRTFDQSRIEEMAAWAGVPLVNALTDQFHPCQLLADLLTVTERRGPLAGLTVTMLGDGSCNMAHSWLLAGATAGMHVRIAAPERFAPEPWVLARAAAIAEETGGSVGHGVDPQVAVKGADVLTTDTWVSMGFEEEAAERVELFAPYRLDADALAAAGAEPLVLHCLPAYRGKEISAELVDGPGSAIWDQAENRRHAQKAVLEFLLGGAA